MGLQTKQDKRKVWRKCFDDSYSSRFPMGDKRPPPVDLGGYDLIGLLGQSNMRNQAASRPGIDDDYSGLQHVFVWDHVTRTIKPAINPLPHIDIVAGTTGMWLQFVRCLPTTRKILLVPCAKGATGFGIHWNKGNAVYEEAVARLNAAKASHADNVIKYMLWHQGEADAANKNANHLNSLKGMRVNMIADVDGFEDSTPFVVGSIHPTADPWTTTINNNLIQFANDVAAAIYVDLTDLAVFDGTHFTAAATQEMGSRYFAALNNGLKLVASSVFDSGVIDTSKIGFHSGNQNYHAIITRPTDGRKALRQNLLSGASGAVDGLTGKPTSGLYTHWMKCNNFYTPGVDMHYAFEMDYCFDHCFWNNDAKGAFPRISGKWFILDTELATDSNSMYFSLNNFGYIRIVSSNGTGPWENWTADEYGWRTDEGTVANGINLRLPSGVSAFYSDGQKRTIRIEVDKHNGGKNHGRMRVFVNGVLLHDHNSVVKNTDADGWFPIPKAFNLKGMRIYAKTEDNGPDALDSTDNPVLYSGLKCGHDTLANRFYKRAA